MSLRICFALLLALPLAGCAQTWEKTDPTTPPGGAGVMADGTFAEGPEAYSSVSRLGSANQIGVVPPYGSKGTAAAYEYSTGYKVGAGDRLTIRVAGEADLSSEYLVDGAGTVSLPYVQTITVAGMTTVQIERTVAARLKAGYLRDPQVSVQVTSLRPFYILGQVTSAGSFAYQPGITVQNAIAIAGGYTPRADQQLVLVTRKNIKGTETYKVPVTTQIYPGDIIYVRERWF